MKKYNFSSSSNEDHHPAGKPVTRKAVNERTHELARLAKHRRHTDINQADYEQAKREITGETDRNRQNAALDASG